ncbi:glioma tumor suppressor candidate region gene 2 protein-like [Elysia marginata]|uniref:Ribosome biogenesis protein NOP53 n=1 Tax=Elysia marginata TaxID=1093978 RepID=A0AAV4J0R3_9GAST|nr:glioma tumor suppressor candidate region gene 2 protein-like [Elysia marginata]
MADQHNAPKLSKKRKLGKNKKKSWCVSKVDDIEEFLEDERQQIRTGGLVAEKADDVLFVVDTSSSKTTADLSEKEPQAKRRRKDKPLKCLALLQPDPHSKAVRKSDGPNFQKGKRTNRILDRLRARSQSQTRLKAAEESRKYAESRRDVVESQKQLPVTAEDLWANDDVDKKTFSVKPPKKYRKKPSALPATLVPHPGASANPSYDDHQALLLEAHNVEIKKEKEKKRLYNALDAKFPNKADAPNESTYLTEMSAGLVSDSEEEKEEDDEESQNTSLSVNPPVRREDRKTKKQRRVEMESKVKEKEKAKMTDIKQRENKVLRIPTIKAEINKNERKQRDRAELKRKKKELEPFKTKRLNSIKYPLHISISFLFIIFEEQDLALKLSTELVGSYRELKPEGHLLKDIYKSVQRRNIVEPRVKQKVKRKYKLKTFEKKGHKAVTRVVVHVVAAAAVAVIVVVVAVIVVVVAAAVVEVVLDY